MSVYQLQRREAKSPEWETIDESENIGKLDGMLFDDHQTPLPYLYPDHRRSYWRSSGLNAP